MVVVFEQGVPNRSLYRRFKIRTVEGVTISRSIGETVSRRYGSTLKGNEPLPQLVLIDGRPDSARVCEEIPSISAWPNSRWFRWRKRKN
ncbi:hypothetical protein MASR2M17_01040 [Aminivibrio sp.]